MNFQTWICPKCYDDHRRDGPCSPMGVDKFAPHPCDNSHIAVQYRSLESEVERLSGLLEMAAAIFDDRLCNYEHGAKCDDEYQAWLADLEKETK